MRLTHRWLLALLLSVAAAGCDDDDDDNGDGSGTDGPPGAGTNPNPHQAGDAARGRDVFRLETFGNEGFWTDEMGLVEGLVEAQLTPVQALQLGLSVNVDALDAATRQAVASELAAQGTGGPLLNSFSTTVALLNANAVIGVAAKDTNGGGIDVASGDKVGVTCALCHAVTDRSVASVPGAGSIGRQVDGPTPHGLQVGRILAAAKRSRAYYPMLQLSFASLGGATIGPAAAGLTENSTEAEVDAYLADTNVYPPGSFDAFPDGIGQPNHIMPFFRTDLSAPWGSAGHVSRLDDFNNTVFTVSFDPTSVLTPGGRALLDAIAPGVGDEIAEDYVQVLTRLATERGATFDAGRYPFVTAARTDITPGSPEGVTGRRVDNQKLLDLNAYTDGLPAPAGAQVDAAASGRGRELFRQRCTSCHHVDQGRFVPGNVVPLPTLWPGYAPAVLAQRAAPFSPIQNAPGTFDDRVVVFDASLRGEPRGFALPLLLDLANKPTFLHDNSVPSLESLLDPARGAQAPHPVYLENAGERADMVQFLRGLGTGG